MPTQLLESMLILAGSSSRKSTRMEPTTVFILSSLFLSLWRSRQQLARETELPDPTAVLHLWGLYFRPSKDNNLLELFLDP